MQKPQGGGKILVQIPRGARGDGYGWNWYLHKIMQWCASYFCHLLFYLFKIHAWLVSSRKFVIWVCTCMRDEYQQDGVGLGPLGCMNCSTCRINVSGYLILTGLYKRWRNNCTTVVGSRWWVLKLFLLSTVMTVTTTKLTRLYKLFAQASLGPVKLYKM